MENKQLNLEEISNKQFLKTLVRTPQAYYSLLKYATCIALPFIFIKSPEYNTVISSSMLYLGASAFGESVISYVVIAQRLMRQNSGLKLGARPLEVYFPLDVYDLFVRRNKKK